MICRFDRTRGLASGALLSAALLVSAPLSAQQPLGELGNAGEEPSREHVVRRGDTLWDLAGAYLRNPFLWPMIYEANRAVVENPHWIYPRERLLIPGLEAEATRVSLPGFGAEEAGGLPVHQAALFPLVRPAERRSAAEPPEMQREPRMVVGRREIVAAPWLGEMGRLPVVARLLDSVDPVSDPGLMLVSAHPYDRLYFELAGGGAPAPGQRLLLVRSGRSLNGWGQVIEPVAIAEVESRDARTATVRLREQFGRVSAGVVALPLQEYEPARGATTPVGDGAQGELLAFVEPQEVAGPADIAFVSMGRSQGVRVGDEIEVYLPQRLEGGRVQQLVPPESLARLRVVRVEDRSATVRVLSLRHAALRPGLPARVIGTVR